MMRLTLRQDPKLATAERLKAELIGQIYNQDRKVLSVSQLLEDKSFKPPEYADRVQFMNQFMD